LVWGEKRRGHWSQFRLGNDELGCDMTRWNAAKGHDGESKGIENTIVTRATGLRPMWLGQGQSTIQRHMTGAAKTGRQHRHSELAAV
jgi:hypothetical protein